MFGSKRKLFKSKSSSTEQKTSNNNNAFKTNKNRKSNTSQTIVETINGEQGQKHRVLVTHLLSMTLTRELETDLLWSVAKGFDLPLVIGEQFICKYVQHKFQSASYHACLDNNNQIDLLLHRFTLTTLFHEPFAQEIWRVLLSKLHDIEKCELALRGIERKDRMYHLKTYKNCFIGKDAVTWLVNYKFATDRNDAVRLGGVWEAHGLIDHVTSDHYFKDEQLFYVFDEFEIATKCKLIQNAKNSKSNHLSNIDFSAPPLTENFSNPTMIRNMSESTLNVNKKKNKKRLKKEKRKEKRMRKQRSKENNSTPNTPKGNVRKASTPRSNPMWNGGKSSNTLVDAPFNEWSDNGDILSDSERIHSPSHPSQNRKNVNTKHQKKRSISWFGSN